MRTNLTNKPIRPQLISIYKFNFFFYILDKLKIINYLNIMYHGKKCFLLNYCISKFLDTEKELLRISDFRTAMLSLALAKHTKGSRPQLGEAYHIHINYPQELLFLLCMEDLDNEGSGGVLFQAFDFYARKTNNPTMPRYIVDEALQRYLSYSIYQKLTDNLGCYTLPL